jgi:hypothetical protein
MKKEQRDYVLYVHYPCLYCTKPPSACQSRRQVSPCPPAGMSPDGQREAVKTLHYRVMRAAAIFSRTVSLYVYAEIGVQLLLYLTVQRLGKEKYHSCIARHRHLSKTLSSNGRMYSIAWCGVAWSSSSSSSSSSSPCPQCLTMRASPLRHHPASQPLGAL